MPIVSQSASASYSLFPPQRLLLPAPKIAGLLPAHIGAGPTGGLAPTPFVYADPRLADLSDKTRAEFDKAVTTLLKVTVGLLADEFNDAAFALANATFARRVTALYHQSILGEPRPVVMSPFVQARQRLDEQLQQMQAESKLHRAETRERIAREIAARRAAEQQP